VERVKTGSRELDEVLHGGFPFNTINVIMGAPGTGKTILAEQLVFANASAESPAVYLTTLSEPLDKFISHGQTHSFFDPAKVGETVFYEDLGLMVRERGIAALAEIVAETLASRKPRLIVIDSYKALTELMETPVQRRMIVFDLASVLTAYDCTSFLVGEYSEDMMTDLPVFAIADSITLMLKHSSGVKDQRFLKIEKLRGSSSIPGMHAFSIDDAGIRVYPRLLTPHVAPTYTARVERVNTGIAGLDEMIAEGFWRGSNTLVAGPTGSGKTAIALHFISEGAHKSEPGLYLAFQENPTQLARIMQNFGWKPQELLTDGNFELMYRSPVEMQLDSVARELFERVREGRVRRVVIDALGDLERSSMDRQRFSDFVYALTQWFAVENVTCLMTQELNDLFEVHGISDREVSNMADNIVLLRFKAGVEMERTIRIIKTRGSVHDNREHLLQITRNGVTIEKLVGRKEVSA
jgi:circadian clock protein KaiC